MQLAYTPITPRSGYGQHTDRRLNSVIEACGAQLGEVAWHSIGSPDVEEVVEQQSARMRALISEHQLVPEGRPIRILEVGAYFHPTAYVVASEFGGVGVACDIVRLPLRIGLDLAPSYKEHAQLVAADFHDLPFSDGYFDLVFISSAVHHTFRPGHVLRELVRVVCPGGVVHLDNEPIARDCCFYSFRCNRSGEATAFERALADVRLTQTISSPYPGSRAEELFGMIENDRIPLDVFEAALPEADRIKFVIDHKPYVGEFERTLIGFSRDIDLESRIATELMARLDQAEKAYSRTDQLLGFSLPRREEVWSLAYIVARSLRALPESSAPGYDRAVGMLFGAALTATLRKSSGTESDKLFRRSVVEDNGVHIDRSPAWPVDMENRLLPAIGTAEAADAFLADAWTPYREADGQHTLLNRHNHPWITLPRNFVGGVAVLRYYVVCPNAMPYVIRILSDCEELWSGVVCQSESQLARFVVPTGAKRLTILFLSLGTPEFNPANLMHLAIAQVMPWTKHRTGGDGASGG
jgi:SAM-dependent methyltransferase